MSDPVSHYDAKLNFADDMSYGDYLGLENLLKAQRPLSPAHDEMLFIIQHQTSELWMRLAIHELNAARGSILARDLAKTFKMLTRVARIFDQLNGAWDVLRTMTPSEYTEFRPHLGNSSGFQSHQYRMIEYILGNRQTTLQKVHEHKPEAYQALARELARESLYQVAIDYVSTEIGTSIETGAPAQEAWVGQEVVQEMWQQVYKQPQTHWEAYELAEKLVDLEDYFRRWRFNHVTTVERIIGFKRGTGGTAGVSYLRKMLDVELFPELWSVRGAL